jgi:uncharacterized protein YdeI (BOF family)
VNRFLAIITTLGSCLLLIACSAPARQAPAVTPAATATAQRLAVLLETATPAFLPATITGPALTATRPTIEETVMPTATEAPAATFTSTPLPTSTATPMRTPAPTWTPPPTWTPRPAYTATPAVTIMAIGDVAERPDGEIVTVSGRVVATASFSHGFKFQLEDDSGRITLLLWHNVYDDSWDAPKLNLGAMVRASGKVGRFEGELQIEPAFGGQVKVTAPATQPPQREIGALGEYIGERVTIVGQIGRVQGGSNGATLTVADDSGEIAVFIWHNTLARIAGSQALGEPGTQVRVTGFVSLFRSNRQIVPALPYDVEVLP